MSDRVRKRCLGLSVSSSDRKPWSQDRRWHRLTSAEGGPCVWGTCSACACVCMCVRDSARVGCRCEGGPRLQCLVLVGTNPMLGLGYQESCQQSISPTTCKRDAPALEQQLLAASINDIHPISRCELCLAQRINNRNHHPKA